MPTLLALGRLKKIAADEWRLFFDRFWLQLGNTFPAQAGQADAYWEEIKGYPQQIVLDMLDGFLHNGAVKCPTAGEMQRDCYFRERNYVDQYEKQQAQIRPDKEAPEKYRRQMVRAMVDLRDGDMTFSEYADRVRVIIREFGYDDPPENWVWYYDPANCDRRVDRKSIQSFQTIGSN